MRRFFRPGGRRRPPTFHSQAELALQFDKVTAELQALERSRPAAQVLPWVYLPIFVQSPVLADLKMLPSARMDEAVAALATALCTQSPARSFLAKVLRPDPEPGPINNQGWIEAGRAPRKP